MRDMNLVFVVSGNDRSWESRVNQILDHVPGSVREGNSIKIEKVYIDEDDDILFKDSVEETRCMVIHPYGLRNRKDVLKRIKCRWVVILTGGSPEATTEGSYFLESDYYTVIYGSSASRNSYIPEWLTYLNEKDISKDVFKDSQHVLRYNTNEKQHQIDKTLDVLDMIEQSIYFAKETKDLNEPKEKEIIEAMIEGIQISLRVMRDIRIDKDFYEDLDTIYSKSETKWLSKIFADKEGKIHLDKDRVLECDIKRDNIIDRMFSLLEGTKEYLAHKKVEFK